MSGGRRTETLVENYLVLSQTVSHVKVQLKLNKPQEQMIIRQLLAPWVVCP